MPLFMFYSLGFLNKSITQNKFYLIATLLIGLACQGYKQKNFYQNSYDESPFEILFKTYFNFFIISIFAVVLIEVVHFRFEFYYLFYWMMNFKMFFLALFAFGVMGAVAYNIPLILLRISMSNNISIKVIKYFNLLIIDFIGICIFRQYSIVSPIDYILGITECAATMFILEFWNQLT